MAAKEFHWRNFGELWSDTCSVWTLKLILCERKRLDRIEWNIHIQSQGQHVTTKFLSHLPVIFLLEKSRKESLLNESSNQTESLDSDVGEICAANEWATRSMAVWYVIQRWWIIYRLRWIMSTRWPLSSSKCSRSLEALIYLFSRFCWKSTSRSLSTSRHKKSSGQFHQNWVQFIA